MRMKNLIIRGKNVMRYGHILKQVVTANNKLKFLNFLFYFLILLLQCLFLVQVLAMCLALNIFSYLTFFFIPSMQMPLYNNCLICVTDDKREWKWRYYKWFILLQMSQNTDHEGNNEKQIIGISDNVEKFFVQKQNIMKHVLVIWKFFATLHGWENLTATITHEI
jgi:hypothetical protein